MNSPSNFSRRDFLRYSAMTAGVVGTVAAGGSLMTACGGGGGGISGPEAALPDYASALRVTPDFPDTAAGVQPGFTSAIKTYPSVTGPIGNGSDVRALLLTYRPPQPPPEQNAWWQAMTKKANVNFRADVAPATDYPAKFGTVMAGNDLPDLVQMPLFMNLPRLPDLLGSRFQDLSDFVSGSAVRKYPNLAGIPTYSWRMARIKGRIYAVPLTRPLIFQPMYLRRDIVDARGLSRPTDAASFETMCRELTDAKAGRWALGAQTASIFNLPFFAQIFGAPVRWGRRPDGTLVKDYETDEFAAAVDFARKLCAAGYFHPEDRKSVV